MTHPYRLLTPCATLSLLFFSSKVLSAAESVDLRYAPPEWQSAVCLPDDSQKSLVDKSGELLYHFGQGGREFATRISVEVVSAAVWQKQQLLSPRVPIVQTFRAADGLQIVEEAFAVTDPLQAEAAPRILRRVDDGIVNRNWSSPGAGVDPALRDIALHNNGSIRYEVTGQAFRVALALCEGWWSEAGKRVQTLRVEGADPKTVDAVADIGKNKAAVFWFEAKDANGDGHIEIEVASADSGSDKNTILNGLWIFPTGAAVDDLALLSGKPAAKALARLSLNDRSGPPRNDVLLVRVTNTGAVSRTLSPRLIVDTTLDCQPGDQAVIVGGYETVTTSLKMSGQAEAENSRRAIPLEAVSVKPGGTAEFFALYSGGGVVVRWPSTAKQAAEARDHAVAYWEKAPLPYGHVEVPDNGIQALLDSSIRNIWQAREIKNGMTAFQVGPTCYRGLWIVDGAFLLEAAALLGAGDQARNGVAYELTNQKPDGRIEVMKDFSKENGIVLWTCVRLAQLTQDKRWLESVWPSLARIAQHIRELRKLTLENDSPLDDGLVPPGFPDGGIGGVHQEYTNPYWNLLGLRAFIEAARWLGKTGEVETWQKEYGDFMAAFRKAAARDMKTDPLGHRYLPIRMDGQDLPQRGQWGFCHAVYPGQLFAKDAPLVAGNLAMLEATEREGMVYGTGWDATGIWNYFASFYGHAWLWQGNGRKAAQVLYAFANHASPVLNWREEQSLQGETFRKVGDMPHNWASAEFIRLAIHLLALDRGDELHLFEGLPAEWTKPGMTTKLNGIATPFGPLTMALTVDADGKVARLRVEPLSDASCKRVVVHLSGWANSEASAVIELAPSKRNDRVIPIALDKAVKGNSPKGKNEP